MIGQSVNYFMFIFVNALSCLTLFVGSINFHMWSRRSTLVWLPFNKAGLCFTVVGKITKNNHGCHGNQNVKQLNIKAESLW